MKLINSFLDKLNKEQKEFVECDNNILVSASAGTGKTSAMVSKLLWLIAGRKIPVKRLLVVTYTKAAANEMLDRLQKLLLKYSSECGVDERKFIYDQIDDLVNADISTIHSVCKKWIVKYFSQLGIDPSFEILDDRESSFLFNKAITNVFNNYTIENNDRFYMLFNLFNASRKDENLKQVIFKLVNFMRTKTDIDGWKTKLFDKSYIENADDNICVSFIFEYLKGQLKDFKEEFERLKTKAHVLSEKHSIYIQNRLNFINDFCDSKNLIEGCFNAFQNSLIMKPKSSNKWELEVKLLDDEIKILGDEFNRFKDNEIKKFGFSIDAECEVDNVYDDFQSEMKFVKSTTEFIFEVCGKVLQEFTRLKKNRNVIDFSDIEYYSNELTKDERIANDIMNSYDYIFVDEYQDVNEMQENIISRIENNNINMIGDVKQSIYEFRRSTPKIFIDKLSKYSSSNSGKVFYFNENYRSDENILEFTNSIMNKLVTKDTIGIDYSQNSQLVSGFKKFNQVVGVKLVKNTIEDNDTTTSLKLRELYRSQAIEVVKHISSLLGTEYRLGDIVGNYTYKDIAILLRNKGDFLFELVKTLAEFNIPTTAKYRVDLFKQIEIITLVSILKIIQNPLNDISLAVALKSKLCGLDENDLCEISNCAGEYLYYKLKNFNANEILKLKISNFLEYISSLRFYYEQTDLVSLINKVCIDNDLIFYFKCLPNGLQREANIKEFKKIASAEIYSHNLSGFIEYLQTIKDKEYELSVSGGDNAVQILTMHGSKGLGFPAIIIADFSTKFNVNMNISDCIINDNFGLGIKYKNINERTEKETIVRKACMIANKKSEIDETIRLFYVALTRAKCNLMLIGTINIDSVNKKSYKNVYHCQSYLDYMLMSLDESDLNYFKSGSENFMINKGKKSCANVNIVEPSNVEKTFENKTIIVRKTTSDVINKNIEAFNVNFNKYKNKSIVVKNSVSSILKEDCDYQLNLQNIDKLNLFDEYNLKENEASEVGTLYHKIMENLELNESLNEIIEKVHEVLSNYECDEKIKDLIDINKIYKAVLKIQLLKNEITNLKKEMQFVMKLPYNKVVESSDIEEKVIVQGVMDLVLVGKDEAIVVDYKTNRSSSKEYYANLYKTQLNLYKLALSRLYPKKQIKGYVYSFTCNELIEM